jgi:hypothetical protein
VSMVPPGISLSHFGRGVGVRALLSLAQVWEIKKSANH